MAYMLDFRCPPCRDGGLRHLPIDRINFCSGCGAALGARDERSASVGYRADLIRLALNGGTSR